MKITLSPVRGRPGEPETGISVGGDRITVGGTEYDLSPVPEGGEAMPQGDDHPFSGKIIRQGGIIHCTVRVLLGDGAEPDQPTDPAHWIMDVSLGPVVIPAIRKAAPEEAEESADA